MAVKITIEGGGLKFETETTLQKAAQVIAFLDLDHVDMLKGSIGPEVQPRLGGTPSTGRTPRQIIDQASAKSNAQKIAAVGLYFKERGQNVFARSEIAEQFRRAGEQIPKNMGRDLKDSVRSGFICESEGQRDEYYLTNDAENLITQGFTSNGTLTTPKGRTSKPKARKSATSTQEPTNQNLMQITFTPVVKGLPNYWATKKGDRVLWILQVAKNNSVSLMDTKDIEYAGKQLDDHIPGGNVNSLTEAQRKKGYLNKQGNQYKLLGPGITYLAMLVKETSDEN